MLRITLFLMLVFLTMTACTLQSGSSSDIPTPTPLPSTSGGIIINPGTPTAFPTLANQGSGGVTSPENIDGVICQVVNANSVSNVAVRRTPDTNGELFYAIQPTYTASVLEIRPVSGSVPWYFVRVDNPIETDLAVVEGWVRSDTVVPRTACR